MHREAMPVSGVSPQSREEAAKITIPSSTIRRWPNMSPSRPAKAMKAAVEIR